MEKAEFTHKKLVHFLDMNYPPDLNPFYYDDDDISSSAGSFFTAEPPQYPLPPPPAAHMAHLKLPPFWTDAPVAWFTAVEAQFQLRRIWAQEEKFCHVIATLDKMSLKKVVHLVVTPDPLQPYNKLKEALLASHQLIDFSRGWSYSTTRHGAPRR